ncbi:hypothetical protein [Paeniglutamicibacter antarcticus]|uniref:hypothetical protein n=1 Tax=Paeniglutamicibacter antarcticus TaxID=494023 RepID=UPI001AE280EB
MGSNTRSAPPNPARPLLRPVAVTIAAMAGAFTFWFLPLPWKFAGLPFAVAGFITGTLTSVMAFRNPGAGMLRFGAPLATLACGLFVLPLAGQLAFYGPSLEYQQCRADALTLRSLAACTQDFKNQLDPRESRNLP